MTDRCEFCEAKCPEDCTLVWDGDYWCCEDEAACVARYGVLYPDDGVREPSGRDLEWMAWGGNL